MTPPIYIDLIIICVCVCMGFAIIRRLLFSYPSLPSSLKYSNYISHLHICSSIHSFNVWDGLLKRIYEIIGDATTIQSGPERSINIPRESVKIWRSLYWYNFSLRSVR